MPVAGGGRAATVQVDRKGPVTTVILNRPTVRNAVDGPTAAALAEAFEDFDADPDAAVAVLFGAGGTFCAGCPGADAVTSFSTAADGNALGCLPNPASVMKAASLLGSDLSIITAGMPP